MTQQLIVLFIVLSTLGIVNASYLIFQSMKKKPLVCPIEGHDCNVVVQSKWNKTFGIKNEYLGFLFYLSMLLGIIYIVFSPAIKNTIFQLMFYAEIGAVLFSAFLVYLQAKIIKEYCFYCLISALITLLLFLNTVLLI